MLSIIVSSHKENFFCNFSQNVKQTIGKIPYEIIQIWNPNIMSISEAYNKGAEKAKYDYLLFVHEDVEFVTKDWGQMMCKYFTLPNVGLLGLAGSKRKFHFPTGHHSGICIDNFLFLNHIDDLKQERETEFPLTIKVVDGVFLAMKRKIWKKLKFDESIKGFHFYDIDISLRASEIYQNYLIHDFDFVHFSCGNFGDQWIKACIKFNNRNFYNFDTPSKEEKIQIRKFWYRRLLQEKTSFFVRIKYVFCLGFCSKTLKIAIKFLIDDKHSLILRFLRRRNP